MLIDPSIVKVGNAFKPDEGLMKPRPLQSGEIEGGKNFGDMIKNAIDSVDEAQKTADQKVEDFIAGKSENIHKVMLSMEKAQLSFQLMTEIRNKVVESYQELSRMQL